MKPNQIFAAMTPERCESLLASIRDVSPDATRQIEASAAIALKFRPQYLAKQKRAKRAASVRSALSRLQSGPLAEETLAVYFLQCRKDLLTEWLDLLGLEHEEGILTQDEIDTPSKADIEKHVATFRGAAEGDADAAGDRELLLQAFGAQSAIEWPDLDALVDAN
jgi:hypothetical protein